MECRELRSKDGKTIYRLCPLTEARVGRLGLVRADLCGRCDGRTPDPTTEKRIFAAPLRTALLVREMRDQKPAGEVADALVALSGKDGLEGLLVAAVTRGGITGPEALAIGARHGFSRANPAG